MSHTPASLWFDCLFAALVVIANTMVGDILINLQDHGLFHPTDIGYCLYTATSRFCNLLGATRLEDIRAGPQTHFHLQYLLICGSGKCILCFFPLFIILTLIC